MFQAPPDPEMTGMPLAAEDTVPEGQSLLARMAEGGEPESPEDSESK